jgi:Hypervirulence associated proteins TUDOR domain
MSQTERIKAAGLSEERGSEPVAEGDHVAWKWGGGMAEGHVSEISESKMVKETKPGVNITRKGEPDNPALFIEREGGNDVVKKQSEVYKMHDE